VPAAIAIARRTRRIVRQNLAWAFGYNLLALPLAAAGLVTPWLAALGMALSSLAVTANSLRLAKSTPRERMPR
jgi:Cu2+-exporting ATPase